ncbi:hypothetical protein BU16DRAFT_56892 [Lophium mytilinum]|uniref:Uncharacterized protein n=1 Tax=Lophium mytilinum TaxID=390894 RepID=A0A6A6QNZ1_9PEZI|nr:hypothetical protein BU16DRAFT_56892 [Lophium mytilinum]
MCKQRWFAYRGCKHQVAASPIEPCKPPEYKEDVSMGQPHTWDVDLRILDGKCPSCTMDVFGWEDEASNNFALEAARRAIDAGLDSAVIFNLFDSPPNFDFPIPEFGALNLDPPTPVISPPRSPVGFGQGPFGIAVPPPGSPVNSLPGTPLNFGPGPFGNALQHPGFPMAAPPPLQIMGPPPMFQLYSPQGMMPSPLTLPPGTVLPPLPPGVVYGPPGFLAGPLPPGAFLGPPPGMIMNGPPPGMIRDPIRYKYKVPGKP